MDNAHAVNSVSAIQVLDAAEVPAGTRECPLELRYPDPWFAPFAHASRGEEIEEQTINWMRGLGLLPREEQTASVRAMWPRVYGGCPSSMLGYESSLFFTQYFTLWLFWDDEVVESATDMKALEPYFAAMAGTLDPVTPYQMAWRHIGDGVEQLGGSARLRTRWVSTMREFGAYAISEVKARNSPSIDNRSLDDALYMRAITVGVIPSIIYLEACCGVELTARVTSTPEYKQLAWHAAVLQGLQNDLASLPKDILKAENGTNVVLRYRRDFGCTLLKACRAIIDIHDASINAFDRQAHKMLAQADNHTRPRLQAYFDYVRYMETGLGLFHTRVDRYVRQVVVENGSLLRLALVRR